MLPYLGLICIVCISILLIIYNDKVDKNRKSCCGGSKKKLNG